MNYWQDRKIVLRTINQQNIRDTGHWYLFLRQSNKKSYHASKHSNNKWSIFKRYMNRGTADNYSKNQHSEKKINLPDILFYSNRFWPNCNQSQLEKHFNVISILLSLDPEAKKVDFHHIFISSVQIQWNIIPKPRSSWKTNFRNAVTINSNSQKRSLIRLEETSGII